MEGKKRKFQSIQKIYDEKIDDEGEKVYKFNILLPNGLNITLTKRNPENERISVDDFVKKVRGKCSAMLRQTDDLKPRRKVLWDSKELCLEDIKVIVVVPVVKVAVVVVIVVDALVGVVAVALVGVVAVAVVVVVVVVAAVVVAAPVVVAVVIAAPVDGSDQTADTFENMWDLTPDTDLLTELPDDYTFETALADLIDNSLQAVWSNGKDERKLISVEVNEDEVSVFDSGPGMDGSDENSIEKWGKMGASAHRSFKKLAIGGKPPYLMPFFGMFGYGGTIASMHLGSHAVVLAKTRESKKVYWLRLDRDALLKRSGSGHSWKAAGGMRDPSDCEIEMSPHGSFTKCDEISKAGRTTTLVDFEINGVNLAEIEGGEVAVTNLHSCNGLNFIVNLHFSVEEDKDTSKSPSSSAAREGNARLKCVYFPIIEGKENIEKILDKLNAEMVWILKKIMKLIVVFLSGGWAVCFLKLAGFSCDENLDFADTDAGFSPIPSKTDLAPQHAFTKALKDLGDDTKEQAVKVQIERGGKQLTLQQLVREYQDWILQMHGQYDDECNCGDDESVLLLNPYNKEALGITSDVARIHQAVTRKGKSWSRGQKVKIFKGACPGLHKNNMYATIEYFLLEGFQNEAGGVRDEDGSVLTADASGTNLELCKSKSLPITVIDSGKCAAVNDSEWNCQFDKQNLKLPSTIEVLGPKQCKTLDIDGALPTDASVSAGSLPPKEVVAILRPSNFSPSCTGNDLDQKYILRDNYEMCLNITFKAEAGKGLKFDPITVKSSSRKGCQGFYIFSLVSIPYLFQKAGVYSFSFSLKNCTTASCEKIVRVTASSKVKRWELLKGNDQTLALRVSAGSCFPPLSFCRYDEFENIIPFKGILPIECHLMSNETVISHLQNVKVELSSDMHSMIVMNARIKTDKLDIIRPSYEAMLALSLPHKGPILSISSVPGSLQRVHFSSSESGKGLLPQQVVEDFKLEMFDRHQNHVEQGTEVELDVHGFSFLDKIGLKRKVDNDGFIDLSGLLKVTEGYGKPVSITVKYNENGIFTKKFQVEKRELRITTVVPEVCPAGSKLKEVAFEVVNVEGDVDQTIDDEKGRCIIPSITLPQTEGRFCIEAVHSLHRELRVKFEVTLSRSTRMEYDTTSDLRGTEELYFDEPQFSDERVSSDSASYAANNLETKGLEFQNSKVTVPVPKEECDTLFSLQTPKVEQENSKPALFSESKLQNLQATLAQNLNKQSDLKCEHNNNMFKTPERKIICADSYTPEKAIALLGSDLQQFEIAEKEIQNHGSCIKKLEDNLKWAMVRREHIAEELRLMQAELVVLPLPLSQSKSMSQKEVVQEKIESKVDSAAAIYSIASQDMKLRNQHPDFMGDVVGLVALLATAPTPMHSCLFAEYLGEDQMLGIVCLSSAAIETPEDYETTINYLAKELGRSFEGRQLFICLEDIRQVYLKNDHQRRLDLPNPTLPDGSTPPGFLGYAVNMIDIDAEYIQVKTVAGRGLRETLFYHLFGDLQVYKTTEQLKYALGCITDAAISLDGCIMRRKGTVSLGSMLVEVHFPVNSEEQESSDREQILKVIKELKSELNLVEEAIPFLRKERKCCLSDFHDKKAGFLKLIKDKEATQKPILSQQSLQTTPTAPAPTQSPCEGASANDAIFLRIPINAQALVVQDVTALNSVDSNNSSANTATDVSNGALPYANTIMSNSKKLQDEVEKTGSKMKQHEDNIKFLKAQKNQLDDAILDLQVSLGKYLSSSAATKTEDGNTSHVQNEEETIKQILKHENSAAGIYCQLKNHHDSQTSNLSLCEDVLGIVASLGKVDDDNLSRPYAGEFLSSDPQRRLDIPKPRLPTGDIPAGFLGFAVNMIHVDRPHIFCLTSNGCGLRETLFYNLFSRLQVYRTRAEMLNALPCISDGAISLDGGMIRSTGVFFLGSREEVDVRFPKCSNRASLPDKYYELENQIKQKKWEKERIQEDIRREQAMLEHEKQNFNSKKQSFIKFLADSSTFMAQQQLQTAAVQNRQVPR
uniref:Protein DEFECTIVE IN MERISTEM SILENCING 3 n=1 Tax=Chenopodium quinoa TaxID=63459 RepID=A0A803L2J8_CHEQI